MKTGIIKAIQPDGGYQSRNGYIYQYQMTIEVQGEGQVTGEIGSKSDPYPMLVGDEINVEITNHDKARTGKKFKKINPQYQQNSGQQASGGGGGRDYDKENRGKIRTQFIKAAIINGQIKCGTFADVIMLTDFAMTGVIPQERQAQQEAVPDSDIPF